MTDAIRFGLGDPDGLRSASFRVWAGKDSSVYLLNRSIGRSFKISLHPREYGYGYTEVYEADHGSVEGGRKIAVWSSETNRLRNTPLKEAFAVVLGRFSLGLSPPAASAEEAARIRRRLDRVGWIADLPPIDHAWQFTVIVSDPGIRTSAPGTRGLGATPVGEVVMPNGGSVWVMRHLIPVLAKMNEKLVTAATAAIEGLGKPDKPALYKAQLFTREESALRALWDISITAKADDADLERAAQSLPGFEA